MEKLKKIGGKLIVCGCELAVGIVLLTDPEAFTRTVLIAVGILLCVVGVLASIRYFHMEPQEAALSQELTRGLVALAFGVLFIYKADWIVRSFMPITIVYGLAALLAGIMKLQWTVDMIRLKAGVWQTSAAASVLTIAVAVVVLLNPFLARKTLWIFTAVSLIVLSVVDLVTAVMSLKERGSEGVQ